MCGLSAVTSMSALRISWVDTGPVGLDPDDAVVIEGVAGIADQGGRLQQRCRSSPA
jgi:hypothetical protein